MKTYLHDSSKCLCVKSYVSPDNLPEILCFISYLKVSSFMWLFRSHYLAKVGQNWLNWQNCLNGDINKAPPLPTNTICLTICRLGKKHFVADLSMVNGQIFVAMRWRCLLFSAMRYRSFLDTRSCAALRAADLGLSGQTLPKYPHRAPTDLYDEKV